MFTRQLEQLRERFEWLSLEYRPVVPLDDSLDFEEQIVARRVLFLIVKLPFLHWPL